MKKRRIAFLLVLALLLSLSLAVFAVGDGNDEDTAITSKYDNIDVNYLTGQGSDPEEFSETSVAAASEKKWYEYVVYNNVPISSIKVTDTCRIIYFDPYDYNAAMVMDVTYDDVGWSTANSIEISHTFSKSLTYETGSETSTNSAVEHQEGVDTNGEKSESSDTTVGSSHTEDFSYTVLDERSVTSSIVNSLDHEHGYETTIGKEIEVGVDEVAVLIEHTNIEQTTINVDTSTEEYGTGTCRTFGEDDTWGHDDTESLDTTTGTSSTTGWSKVADRITVSTGSSSSTNTSWSAEESTTISKTFNASYFNSSGSPLTWTIAYYEVKMPMRCEMQLYANGEWNTIEECYCLLTTIEGSCRAWRENTVTYFEHWGTGEPVTDSDFWADFFTEESLIAAYENRFYPN